MKLFSILTMSLLLLSGCVSKKKYAELQSEVERLKGMDAVVESLKQSRESDLQGRKTELEEAQRQIHELKRMMSEQAMMQQYAKAPPMTPEQRAMMDEERRRAHELEMMKMHQAGGQTGSPIDQALTENEQSMRVTFQALKNALSSYDESKSSVERNLTPIVVMVKDDVVFGTDKISISASGDTWINRFLPALKVADGLRITLVGISAEDSAEGRNKAAAKANALHAKMLKDDTYKKFNVTTASQSCSSSPSGRMSGCERIEIVIDYNYEEVIKAARGGF